MRNTVRERELASLEADKRRKRERAAICPRCRTVGEEVSRFGKLLNGEYVQWTNNICPKCGQRFRTNMATPSMCADEDE